MLLPSVRVPDETQGDRYKREREHCSQVETVLDDHQPALLLSPLPSSTAVDGAVETTRVSKTSHECHRDPNLVEGRDGERQKCRLKRGHQEDASANIRNSRDHALPSKLVPPGGHDDGNPRIGDHH